MAFDYTARETTHCHWPAASKELFDCLAVEKQLKMVVPSRLVTLNWLTAESFAIYMFFGDK